MIERRCPGPHHGHDLNTLCHQLLFRYTTEGTVEVKCPRCKTVTVTRVTAEVLSYKGVR